ncbi:MAG: UDP-N-acetylmuramate:L-alanyl-gamma-D-glutamyl-meso-diaminopimelate ligase [Gammaproteobacteria bacterium]|nr:UDP-N-acetylmuramate:L-alanyl-gamma-D-glutamyl-meso-diaminopimelate ligase [Gammaproteobacteria bacterium]|tara:strand:+ start:7 stop:1305 length:1299 start_codon:yes stop_codon:yes gene_type:complete
MRIHILGVCGTFMAGLAQILKESGHVVSGSDVQFYPPMSDYLRDIDINTIDGYEVSKMPEANLYVIGNALSRGNECVEYILDNNLAYTSGPSILGKELRERNVFAVSGTHGKTSTAYMLTHILNDQGRDVGYLVGGISKNFKNPARLGSDKTFVIEADEYDSAFFDKRSKFINYHPKNLIVNNIEFDHADIFDDINDIKRQFHHLVKLIPNSGNIIYYQDDENTSDVLSKASYSNLIAINADNINVNIITKGLTVDDETYSLEDLPLIGEHNLKNYVCAILAAQIDGIEISDSIDSLKSFLGVKRRMEKIAEIDGIKIYDDFAHHPTAIRLSSNALRNKHPQEKILGIIELGSNTMSSGYHEENLLNSFESINEALVLDLKVKYEGDNIFQSIDALNDELIKRIKDYDIILIMTNRDSQKFIKPILESFEEK